MGRRLPCYVRITRLIVIFQNHGNTLDNQTSRSIMTYLTGAIFHNCINKWQLSVYILSKVLDLRFPRLVFSRFFWCSRKSLRKSDYSSLAFSRSSISIKMWKVFPSGIYLLKVNNRNTRTRCEVCSKLTLKIPERRQWFLFVNFEQVIASWVISNNAILTIIQLVDI